MKRLNILMVSAALYPEVAGGSWKVAFELGKALVKSGHMVYIIGGSSNNNLPNSEIIDEIHIERCYNRHNNAIISTLDSLKNFLRKTSQLITKNKFDVINFHNVLPATGTLLFAKSKHIPSIVTFHSPEFLDFAMDMTNRNYKGIKKTLKPFYVRGYSFLLKKMEKRYLRSSDLVVCLSNYMKDIVRKTFLIPEVKIRVIPHSVDTEKFYSTENIVTAKQKIGIDPNKWVILTVRRLEYRMGIDNLIRAIVKVRKYIPQVLLLIVGSGSLKQYLRDLISDMKLDGSVKFTGFVEDGQLPEYYRAADLFVLPTRELEGFGLVTLEALASGVPVIGTPVGGTVEILHDLDPELLTDGSDSASIADAIIRFYEQCDHKDSLSEKCRDYVLKKYTWDSVAAGYEDAFKKTILQRK